MAAFLATMLCPSVMMLQRVSALHRFPALAAVQRTRGAGFASMAAKAHPAPEAVPLTTATITPSADEAASWSGDLLLVPCWEAAEKDAPFALSQEARAALRARPPPRARASQHDDQQAPRPSRRSFSGRWTGMRGGSPPSCFGLFWRRSLPHLRGLSNL